jgi:hypothetical protein
MVRTLLLEIVVISMNNLAVMKFRKACRQCEQIKMFVGNIPRRRTTKKCAEPVWNKVAKEREQYGEVEEVKETREMAV